MAKPRSPDPEHGLEPGFLARHDRLVVSSLAGLALVLRLWNLEQIRAHDPYFAQPTVDPAVYHQWAVEISHGDLAGHGVFFNGPGYPYFLGLIYAVAGPSFLAAKFVHCILGALTAGLTWALGTRLVDRRVGLVAGLLAATHAVSIFYGGELLGENLQTPLDVGMLLLLVSAGRTGRLRTLFLGATLLGLSALVRPTVLLFAPAALGWVAWRWWGSPRRDLVRRALAFTTGIAVTVLPVTIRNAVVGHDFVLVNSQGGVNFYVGNSADATGTFHVPGVLPRTRGDSPTEQRDNFARLAEGEVGHTLSPSAVSRYWTGRALRYVAAHPGWWVRLLGRKLALFWNGEETSEQRVFSVDRRFSAVFDLPLPTFGVVAPLALVGLFVCWSQVAQLAILYLFVATQMASLVLMFVVSRYRLPILPALQVFAAAAGWWLIDRVRARDVVAVAGGAAGLVLAARFTSLTLVDQRINVAMSHYNLGNKYSATGRRELAIAEYREAIALDPRYISSHNNLALALMARPETRDDAIREWREVDRIARDSGDTEYVARARRYLTQLGAEMPEPRPEAVTPRP